jgi:hypothetical protein
MPGQPIKCICGGCSHCRKRVQIREWKRKNPAKTSKGRRAWAARNPDKILASARAYRQAHPEKKRAHNAVTNAIRDGKLERGACEVCGAANAHAHHDDYSRPLDVRWLCRTHHEELHRMPATEAA